MPTSFLSSRLVVLLSLLAASPCLAADDKDPEFQEHYQKALQLYKQNSLRQAVLEFQAAYALRPLPRLLYNVAQIHRKLGEFKDSIDEYEQYLRTDTELTPARKKEVESYVAAMRSSSASANSAGTELLLPDAPDSRPAEPPSHAAPDLTTAGPPPAGEKGGRFMAHLGIGYALPLYSSGAAGLASGLVLRPDFAVALSQDRNRYFVAAAQFQLIENSYQILLTAGFQFDIPIATPGLYVTVRGSFGYSAHIATSAGGVTIINGVVVASTMTTVTHFGVFIPEIGLKYVVSGKLNLGFEPFSLPISFNPDGTEVGYRPMFYGGYNF